MRCTAALLCWLTGNMGQLEAQVAETAANFSVPAQASQTAELMKSLSDQGIVSTQVMGTDRNGIPILCGTIPGNITAKLAKAGPKLVTLPAGAHAWTTIPCVIRNDGVDTFRLEVNANTSALEVTLDCWPTFLPAAGGTLQQLRDDGLGQDRVAGDNIWTSVLLRANTNSYTPQYFASDTNSPAGLNFGDVGAVKIKLANGQTNEFLIWPQVGLLHPQIPLTTARIVASNVQATPHLLNIRGASQAAQRDLRTSLSGDMAGVTTALYQVVPDAFDFLVFITTDHIEVLPRLTPENFNAGIHYTVQVNYTGTGLGTYNASSYYGSRGRLLSINVLDTNSRGVYSANVTHELLHQWLVFTDYTLQLDDYTGHYNYRSGAASLLGGTQFIESTNGGIIINCKEGRSGAHSAPPLDKYMMGLIDGSAVPPIKMYSSSLSGPYFLCDQFISNIVRTVTISNIQQLEGIRTPGPATAQRDFSLGFVIESHERLLNATELTFYEILARHYTKPLPASEPAPYIEQNWAPVTKFFGEGTTWRCYVPAWVQPRIHSVLQGPDRKITLAGSGFPKASYNLECSSNLVTWSAWNEVLADTNGYFQVTNTVVAGAQFYRALWNE